MDTHLNCLTEAIPVSTHNIIFLWRTEENKPHHDKTNKVACAPNEDSDQPGHLSDQRLRCPHEESLGS